MKGQMLPLICLHNSPWSPGWLIPTQGLPACHPVTRVFYSRRSEPNKEPNQAPRSPERKATDACALNGRVCIKRPLAAHHIRRQSPVLQPFLWGGARTHAGPADAKHEMQGVLQWHTSIAQRTGSLPARRRLRPQNLLRREGGNRRRWKQAKLATEMEGKGG